MAKKVNEDNLPLISIIMPCYNGEKFISHAILSVVSQSYPNFELYIKDGGSTDGTVSIIKKYAKQYPDKVNWISKKDLGQTDAINFGLKKTKGEIVAYLNADDLYKPGTFKKIAAYFNSHPDKMWVIGKSDIINDKGSKVRPLITSYKNIWLSNYSYKSLLVLNYISQMGVFWRRSVIKKVGNFDTKQYYVMDYEYWLRLGSHYHPGLVPEYVASFRIVNSSKSSTGFIKQFNDEYKVAKKYTKSTTLLNLHLLHNKMITSVYSLMKFMS